MRECNISEHIATDSTRSGRMCKPQTRVYDIDWDLLFAWLHMWGRRICKICYSVRHKSWILYFARKRASKKIAKFTNMSPRVLRTTFARTQNWKTFTLGVEKIGRSLPDGWIFIRKKNWESSKVQKIRSSQEKFATSSNNSSNSS